MWILSKLISILSIKFSPVDAVYAMAHSLHNLVLDVCCNSSQFYNTKEEALKVFQILFWMNLNKNIFNKVAF